MQGWSLPVFQTKALKPRFLHRFQGPGGWLLSLTVAVAMLFWNWKLLVATGVGMFVMVLVYWMQEWDWQVPWSDVRRFLNGSNRQLTLAAGSGGIATLSTYMTASIWVDSDSPWIAAGAILQGLGTLTTLILLVWQIVSWQASREEAQMDDLLTELTDADPLKRLIAVRQLTRLVTRTRFDSSHHKTVAEYLRLLLSREQESVIREAVFDSLQALDKVQQLSPGSPFSTPVALKRPVAKVSQLRE
jgi:hypothetical protein